MNALWKKEIRILLPSFIVAFVLAFSALLLTSAPAASGFQSMMQILPFISPILLLMMALNSFGRELSAGMFSNLLSQPIPRVKIWHMKTILLAAAFGIVWVTWWICLSANQNLNVDAKDIRVVLIATTLISTVLFSGALWTVLLLRQVVAAFWFTLIVPAALVLPILSVAPKYPDAAADALVTSLTLYSIAGFVFARWLFMRAQDVAWTGGVIAFPEWRSAERIKTNSAARHGLRPLTALFWKEIQLHQSQFVVAGVLALLHLAVVLVRNFGGDFTKQPAMAVVLEGFLMLWFVMPLLIGCAAVSEERRLNTLESQLCLPVRRRTQFWIKFSSALLLSVLFGFLMPLLFEGKQILPSIEMKAAGELVKNFPNDAFIQSVSNAFLFVGQLLPILIPLGIIVVILTVSFYASTLSRNTLQSLAPAVLGIGVAFMVLIGASDAAKVFHYPLWRGWLIYIIGVPVLTLTVFALMEWNFKHVWMSWRVGRRNAAVFLAALVLVVGSTTAIYHRFWEFLTPIEPVHGVARLEKSGTHKMESFGWRSTILLADGRAWSAWPSFGEPDFLSVLLGDWNMEFKSGAFWNGSNWASVASSYFDDVGIKEDGSLWVSEEPRKPDEFRKVKYPAQPLVRVGDGNDWKSVSFAGRDAFLLKRDGTLWSWGETASKVKNEWQGLRAIELEPLGTNSDWIGITQLGGRTVLGKAGDEAWVFAAISTKETNRIKLDDKISMWRAGQWDGLVSVVGVSGRDRSFGNLQVGIDKAGNLLIVGGWEHTRNGYELAKKRVLLSKESDWLAVAGEGETVVALKADGSLWKWRFPDNPITKPESASAVRLGKHSDWIAIADQFGGVTSLAADGSLWFWRSDDPFYSSSAEAIPPLLAASRRPQKIGNIFDTPSAP